MNIKITNFLAALLLSLVGNVSQAQLSGVVTINSGIPTSGNNYQSFTAFRTALVAGGVTGPLTVNVAANSGPYNEQVDFPAITGVNATNTITVNGNGCVLSFNSTNSAAPWTLGLNGADYMTFNDLKIEGLGSTYALTCHLWNIADFNAFNTCTITAPESSGSTSSQVPLSLSGSATAPTTSGNFGNNNVFTSCLISGGYYGVTMYGMTSAPFNLNNNLFNCTIRDFYTYGVLNYYHRNFTWKGNTFERPNQSSSSTCVGIYLSTQSYSATIEGNLIHKLFENCAGNTSTSYGMYLSAAANGSVNTIRNNIISITKCHGTIYGLNMTTSNYYNVIHNTISLGDATTLGTGAVRGIYCTGGTSTVIRNNIINVTHGGTGTKYCLYFTLAGTTSNNNVLYMNSSGAANHIGYYSGNQTLMTNWQAANASSFDQASWNTDPMFVSPPFGNYTPSSNVFNNGAANLGVADDYYLAPRGMNPDPGAIEFFNTACAGAPAGGTVIVPSSTVCPGATALLGFSNFYSGSGLTFQWQTSTVSPIGPFTAVSGATNQYVYTAPINNSVWYSAVVTCANGSSITLTSSQLSVVPTVTSSVPYFEGFEGITGSNRLPNCSWAASNMPAECQTNISTLNYARQPRTGSNYASFYQYPSGQKYFYTNGIQLYAGITYSGSVWAIVGSASGYYNYYPDWAGFSLMVGPNQSPTGMVSIANTGATFTSPMYTPVSSTFQVPTSGIYYVAVRATGGNGYGYNPYLSWDDLSITIPCELNPVNMSINSSTNTICSGSSVEITVTGADSLIWNSGQTTASISVFPNSNTNYVATGLNAITGCSSTVSQLIIVNPSPVVSIVANPLRSCAGEPVNLNAIGADSYIWSGSAGSTPGIIVKPLSTTIYSVIGINSFGCDRTATVSVDVDPLPVITAVYPNEICLGESAELLASGADTYEWISQTQYLPANPVLVSPLVTTTYTLNGTDVNGCESSTTILLTVDPCTGISEHLFTGGGVVVYPNPTTAELNVELKKGTIQMVEVLDLTGRVLLSVKSGSSSQKLDLTEFSNGVYYARILTNENLSEMIKVVKQ